MGVGHAEIGCRGCYAEVRPGGGKVLECCLVGVQAATAPEASCQSSARDGVGLWGAHILGGIRTCVLGAWVHVPALACRGLHMFHSNLRQG